MLSVPVEDTVNRHGFPLEAGGQRSWVGVAELADAKRRTVPKRERAEPGPSWVLFCAAAAGRRSLCPGLLPRCARIAVFVQRPHEVRAERTRRRKRLRRARGTACPGTGGAQRRRRFRCLSGRESDRFAPIADFAFAFVSPAVLPTLRFVLTPFGCSQRRRTKLRLGPRLPTVSGAAGCQGWAVGRLGVNPRTVCGAAANPSQGVTQNDRGRDRAELCPTLARNFTASHYETDCAAGARRLGVTQNDESGVTVEPAAGLLARARASRSRVRPAQRFLLTRPGRND
jgi:hypothetical protein